MINQASPTPHKKVSYHADVPPGPLPPALQPPLLAQLLLEWVLPRALQEPVLGDLQEEFIARRKIHPTKARWWYRKQACQTCWYFLSQTRGDWLMFIFSMLFFAAVSMWVMWISGADNLSMFFDVVSLALIFPCALLFAIGATSRQTAQLAFGFLCDPRSGFDTPYYQKLEHFFNVLGHSALLLGGFTTLIGAVAIANGMTSQNFASEFGPAMGICLLAVLYGLGIKTIAYIAAQKVCFVAKQSSTALN
jgi:chemotaxis protein MotA